jgi:outer membrane protein OmpA-like peptidoglycan-associated protein
MKKQLFLIGLIFTMFVAYSQTTTTKSEPQPTATADTVAEPKNDFCPHRILLRFGGGYANNIFKEIKDFATICSYTAMAELGYTYFFHKNVGIGIGLGINRIGTIAKINHSVTLPEVLDNAYFQSNPYPYAMSFHAYDLKQKQGIWAIEVPLTVQFEKKFGERERNGIYAGVGVKGYFPFSSNIRFTDGVIDITEIVDRDGLNVTFPANSIDIHMESQEFKGGISAKQKMRCSIDILGEFGGVFGLSRKTDFYIGVYASYGFLNIMPKEGYDLSSYNQVDPRLGQITNQYVNTTDKWNLFQVGLKMGFHFLPCKNRGNDDYMRDLRRKYYKEMAKKQNEPIIVTNTVQEFYYYIVPTISEELLEETKNNADKNKAIRDLAQSLSMIKILFDLDRDIPKLNDRNKEDIKNAVAILKANPDLKIVITGYTSPEGSQAHNENLAQRRANAVKNIFVNDGVPADQIATNAFTAADPQHRIDLPETEYFEQRAVIFRIESKK